MSLLESTHSFFMGSRHICQVLSCLCVFTLDLSIKILFFSLYKFNQFKYAFTMTNFQVPMPEVNESLQNLDT